ncbi:MAG: hypothetical protein ACI8WT_000746 [Clostridium sp.]|jgi:hypothetical protein
MKTVPITSARQDIFNIIEQTIANSEPIQQFRFRIVWRSYNFNCLFIFI